MKNYEGSPWKAVLIGTAFVVFFLFLLGVGSDKNGSVAATESNSEVSICDTPAPDLSSRVAKVDYKQLKKDPNSFKGVVASFSGQVIQIQQSGDFGVVRLAVTKAAYGWDVGDILYVTYHRATPAVEDDIVTVTGILTGEVTYTSQANYQIAVPGMDVCSVVVKK